MTAKIYEYKKPRTARRKLSPKTPSVRKRTAGNGKSRLETIKTSVKLLRPEDGTSFDFDGLGIHWKVEGADTGFRFAVVHHPIAPHALAAPLHRHQNEDELSYVLKGKLGALLGDDVVTATQGTWVFKPRAQWHTFWNAADVPCEIIEVISPAGFENYFREVAAVWGDLDEFAAINKKYSLDMDFESVPRLCRRFGLTFPELREMC